MINVWYELETRLTNFIWVEEIQTELDKTICNNVQSMADDKTLFILDDINLHSGLKDL